MNSSTSTSPLVLLSMYTSLRRSGTSESDVLQKVRDLVNQLDPAERSQLITRINDWETDYGAKLDENAADATLSRATLVMTPDAAQIYGTSEYDHDSSLNPGTALRPLHQVVICPSCRKKNDGNSAICAYCGKPLEQPDAASRRQDEAYTDHTVALTWFGPDSKLVLTIGNSPYPLELPVTSTLTFGR